MVVVGKGAVIGCLEGTLSAFIVTGVPRRVNGCSSGCFFKGSPTFVPSELRFLQHGITGHSSCIHPLSVTVPASSTIETCDCDINLEPWFRRSASVDMWLRRIRSAGLIVISLIPPYLCFASLFCLFSFPHPPPFRYHLAVASIFFFFSRHTHTHRVDDGPAP